MENQEEIKKIKNIEENQEEIIENPDPQETPQEAPQEDSQESPQEANNSLSWSGKFLVWVILSLIIMIATGLIITGGSFSENGIGAAWWIFIPLIGFDLFILLPVAIFIAIVEAISNRKKKK